MKEDIYRGEVLRDFLEEEPEWFPNEGDRQWWCEQHEIAMRVAEIQATIVGIRGRVRMVGNVVDWQKVGDDLAFLVGELVNARCLGHGDGQASCVVGRTERR